MIGWPGLRQVGLAFGLGAVMALGQAPLDAWYLTLPALAGLLWLTARQVGVWQAAFVGWFGGAGYFGVALNWIVEPFFIDFASDGWMAPFAPVLMAFGLGLFWAGAGAFSAPIAAGGPLAPFAGNPMLPFVVGACGIYVHGEILGGLVSASAWATLSLRGPLPTYFEGTFGLRGCVLWVLCASVSVTAGVNESGFYLS